MSVFTCTEHFPGLPLTLNQPALLCCALQAWIASRTPDLAGVVLHSPLLSGIRVLSPTIKWWPAFADVYPNHLLAPKIKSPVLVMHVSHSMTQHGTACMSKRPCILQAFLAWRSQMCRCSLCDGLFTCSADYCRSVTLTGTASGPGPHCMCTANSRVMQEDAI